jgi:GST-like protein
MLEELGLEYKVIPIDIGAGDQFKPEFLAISPNNKMPAIVDHDGPGGTAYSMFESGAILIYLAEKTGRFIPSDVRERYDVIQWIMFQMGHIGPMLGQNHHFRRYAPEKIPYAIERYTNEAARLYGVLDKRLEGRDYLVGEYSIADIANYPWLRSHEAQGQDLNDFPSVKRWYEAIEARPAVQRGVEVLSEETRKGEMSEAEREQLFGNAQYARH